MNSQWHARQSAGWSPWNDAICLVAWGAYFLNRFWLAPHWGAALPFLRAHFNDALLIPAALPLLVWARSRLGLRDETGPPTAREVLLWCAVWSLAFEGFGPRVFGYSVGDRGDVAAYCAGGAVAVLWWNWRRKRDTHKQKPSGRSGVASLS